MRWEDERYVRLYTRNTADWMSLSWNAQALLMQLLRVVDRAGFLELGRHGKRSVALVLGRPDLWEGTIEDALDELLRDGCIVIEGGRLLFRNFIEAQETRQTDAARKRAQREKERDLAVTAKVATPESHDVTSGHQPSHSVTLCCAVPSRAVLNHAVAAEGEARDFGPEPEPEKPAAAAAAPKPEPWDEFFIFCQVARSAARPGLAPEPPPVWLRDWYEKAVKAKGVDDARLRAAWEHSWLHDKWASSRKPRFAFAVFSSDKIWPKHLPEAIASPDPCAMPGCAYDGTELVRGPDLKRYCYPCLGQVWPPVMETTG